MDPKDRVTDTAFHVASPLLGVALATPTRRAAALGVDLLLAAVVAEVGGGAVAGLVAADLFILVAMRKGSRHPLRRVARGAFVGVGALILFGVGVAVVDGDGGDYQGPGGTPDVDAMLADLDRDLEAAGLGSALASSAYAGGAGWPDSLTDEERADATAALRGYADALAARDSARADSLRDAVRPLVAGEALDRRDHQIEELQAQRRALRGQNARLREDLDDPSFLRTLRTLGTDFGLSLGWIGVYFTLTLAVWGGYTPGKRLLGVRVYRLDGGRLSLWTAFERFGGYAAGLATGLVGFAQVLWDPNRQGVQDKVAGTVVVRMADPDTPRRAVERDHPAPPELA